MNESSRQPVYEFSCETTAKRSDAQPPMNLKKQLPQEENRKIGECQAKAYV